jgi:hypothetical protein
MEGYVAEEKRLDALYEAMQMVLEEFADTKDAEVAAAGHVIAELFIKRTKELDTEMDEPAAAEGAGM